MEEAVLARALERSLAEIPLVDVHTHLSPDHLAARGLHDILLYHMVVSDLASAGCPDRHRLSGEPTDQEAGSRIERALPFLPAVGNTSCMWGVRLILEDLFGWKGPITQASWRRLDGLIRERAGSKGRAREIMARAGIVQSCTDWYRRKDDSVDDLFGYSLEWGFFARCQPGEYDTALYELEKAWSDGSPGVPRPNVPEGKRAETSRRVRTMDDIEEGMAAYVAGMPKNIVSTAHHFSTDIDFSEPDAARARAALRRRGRAGREERDTYASWVQEAFYRHFEEKRAEVLFQFSFGAEPLPFETGSRMRQSTVAALGEMIARHPRIRFQCLLGSAHVNQGLCTLARELPNFSLAGYWWHSFFPAFIERAIEERLDMLSTASQVGFFSDAYTLEWSYAKAVVVRRILGKVLARKVLLGQYTKARAVEVAREILFGTPSRFMGAVVAPAALPRKRVRAVPSSP